MKFGSGLYLYRSFYSISDYWYYTHIPVSYTHLVSLYATCRSCQNCHIHFLQLRDSISDSISFQFIRNIIRITTYNTSYFKIGSSFQGLQYICLLYTSLHQKVVYYRTDLGRHQFIAVGPDGLGLFRFLDLSLGQRNNCVSTVSYTHLDVYKRQSLIRAANQMPNNAPPLWAI